MAESKKKNPPVKEESEDRWSFIPYFAERRFGTIEDFVSRLAGIATDRAEHFINHSMQKFGLFLLLGIGALFLFTGGAKAIDGLVGFPGIGQMVVGTLILFVAGIAMLLTRHRAS